MGHPLFARAGRRAPMNSGDWDKLYSNQRKPCPKMDDDPGATHCDLREGHEGKHNTRSDGSGRSF